MITPPRCSTKPHANKQGEMQENKLQTETRLQGETSEGKHDTDARPSPTKTFTDNAPENIEPENENSITDSDSDSDPEPEHKDENTKGKSEISTRNIVKGKRRRRPAVASDPYVCGQQGRALAKINSLEYNCKRNAIEQKYINLCIAGPCTEAPALWL